MIQSVNKWPVRISILEKKDDLILYVNDNYISNVLRHLAILDFDGNITGITIGTHTKPETK